jgi:hypothetical protein
MTSRNDYFDFIKQGFWHKEDQLDQEINDWKKTVQDNSLLGYMPTRFPLHLAVVEAFLFEQSGDKKLAELASRNLMMYRDFTKYYPINGIQFRPEYEHGVPPLDAVFDPAYFAPACLRLRPVLSESEYGQLADIAADSLRLIWRFPEWGGHNRAMLRAASLAACARAFPNHHDARNWITMADELAEESWGRWSIEDTQMYLAHWLRALILYAESRGKTELVDLIQPRFYTRAIIQLISPLGILPDYGDSHWMMHSQWEWLALMEWGARTFQDPTMKWAAEQLWRRQQRETPNLYASLVLILAWSWCDDSLVGLPPIFNPDALDDLVMKKIVFRTGWDEGSTYSCLNYRDEGDYGRVARDYLRTNLAVSAEKMHHGHSDEGSFCMLVHKGTLLLHESGYRENPPDGIYRADVYHNRLVWRPQLILPGEDLWDFLKDNGHYKQVKTERLYQTKLCGVDICRIRVTDEKQNISWDRSIFFLPEVPLWAVIDSVYARRTAPRTYSSLFWTNEILDQSEGWFRTHISRVQSWENEKNSSLGIGLLETPGQKNQISFNEIRRCFQQEKLIANTWSGEHLLGRVINFVTILQPLGFDSSLLEKVRDAIVVCSQPVGRSLGVEFTLEDERLQLTTLNDLAVGYLQEDIRPRYTAEQGWWQINEIGSDAAFTVLRQSQKKFKVGFLNGTRLTHKGQDLYRGPIHAMFQEDRSHKPGVPARFRWETEN